MLVLSRDTAESIHIGEDIVVRILTVGFNKVRIGIEAPKGIKVMRSELLDKKKEKDTDDQ